jgi:hypothetical protein
MYQAFESLESFTSNLFGIIDDPRDSLNRMRGRFVIMKRGGHVDLRTFRRHVRQTSSRSHDGIVGVNRVSSFYSFPLLRASRDGFRRGFDRRKRNTSLRNVNSWLIGRHGHGVSRLAFRCHTKGDVMSFLRRRDSFEESQRV